MQPCKSLWGATPSLLRRLVPIVLFCSIAQVTESAPPNSLGIPIIKSFLDGAHSNSHGLKELVSSHSNKLLTGSNGSQKKASPKEISNLISKLKPRQGKLDPVVMDMLSAFDRTYRDTSAVAAALQSSAETFIFPDETASTRVASSTEENSIIWQDATSRPQKRDRDSNRYSSRYRSNRTNSSNIDYRNVNNTNFNSTDQLPPNLPFNHVTDPNLRNHRLYAWEFETRNFTHIDQTEDLMADEDRATETKVSVVAAPPPSSNHQHLSPLDKVETEKNNKGDTANIPNLWPIKSNGSKSKRVKVKGIPHIVISLEDTGYDPVGTSYNYQVPIDSGERDVQRPREPLRHSSTENIVYVHGSAEYPYPTTMQEVDERYPSHPGMRSQQFRPSSVDIANDMFVDPDQDFFTSTLRSTDQYFPSSHQTEQEVSSETIPKRRRKKLKKMNTDEIHEISQHGSSSSRFSNRLGERQLDDGQEYSTLSHHENTHAGHGGVQYSPVYSRNSMQGSVTTHDRARAHQSGSSTHHTTGSSHLPASKANRYQTTGMEAQGSKSDRIMYPTAGSPTAAASDLTGYALFNQGQQQSYSQGVNPLYDTTASGAQHHDGGIGNYYSLHNDPNLHQQQLPNLGSTGADHVNAYGQNKHPLSNHEATSTEYLGGHMNRIQNVLSALNIFSNQQQAQLQNSPAKKLQPAMADQVIAPGNIEDFYHPYAASDHQVNQFYEDSYYAPWSNTWLILAGLIAFTAIFALILPALLSSQRHGKKDIRHDLDEEDLNTSTYQGPPNNHFPFDNTQNEAGPNSDIWTEIKGVYNDLVNAFRGDYSLLSKLKKVPEGPKIVYREEEDHPSSDEEEDDERETRLTLRNRKRKHFLKKQQQKRLKKKQQQQQQQNKLKQQQQSHPTQPPQHGHNQGQGKSNGGSVNDKQTLVSKTEASRESHGKTIDASSVNNLVVVSGPPPEPIFLGKEMEDLHTSSPRAVPGFAFSDTSTLATMPFLNLTGYGGVNALPNSFLQEWAQVQLINHLPPQ